MQQRGPNLGLILHYTSLKGTYEGEFRRRRHIVHSQVVYKVCQYAHDDTSRDKVRSAQERCHWVWV